MQVLERTRHLSGLEIEYRKALQELQESTSVEAYKKVELEKLEQRFLSLQTEVESVSTKIRQTRELSLHLGVDTNPDIVARELQNRLDQQGRLEAAVEQARSDIGDLEARESQLHTKSPSLHGSLNTRLEQLDELEAILKKRKREAAELLATIGLVDQTEELADHCKSLEEEVMKQRIRLQHLNQRKVRVEQLRDSVLMAQRGKESKLDLEERREKENLAFVREFVSLWRSQRLAEPVEESQLLAQLEKAQHYVRQLQDVLAQAESYVRCCRLELLEAETKTVKKELREERATLTTQQSAAATHNRWIEQLERDVSDAVKTRISAFGDEINALFHAMVAFPEKFDRVTVSNRAHGVEIGLVYKDSAAAVGEPRFYLSSAEMNLLALSVFLSFATTQRWFRMSTLLLDDPAQHLDDLDAVAFLDTIRAIATAAPWGRRQVLFSTCDRELYRLIVRKFSLLNESNLTFTAISLEEGRDGPRAQYDVGGPERISLVKQSAYHD